MPNKKIPLPPLVRNALKSLHWDLTSSQCMQYKPLSELTHPVLPDAGEVPVSQLLGVLRGADGWARISAALILLGHAYVDEAHNLIGPLSFHQAVLPYFWYGPAGRTNPEQESVAAYVHCLVHRREGIHESEYGQSGFGNSRFWAGAMMGADDSVPLTEIREAVESIANPLEDSRQWFDQNIGNEEWNPRSLTELCEAVVRQGGHHPLKEFAERAAIAELQVLLQFSLTRLGFDLIRPPEPINIPAQIIGLPTTMSQALTISDKALVVTTLTAPHMIVHVNQEWVNLCGYSCEAARLKTFNIIQGAESNTFAASECVQRCLTTRQAQQVHLVNYTAAGERFVNCLRIGVLFGENSLTKPEYLVGILQRVEAGLEAMPMWREAAPSA